MSEAAKKRIYLDYASLTPIDPAVVEEMARYSSEAYANPSSLYKEGVAAKVALADARTRLATCIGAHEDEIIFTSGGTESNNLAIIGAVECLREQGMAYRDMHVIASAIEHSSVRECLNYLNGREVATDIVEVGSHGIIDPDDLKKKIRPNTVIVSIMTVNNELGTVQPIRQVAKIIRQARKEAKVAGPFSFQSLFSYPLFHTDAAQAALYQDLAVEKLGVDLMTLDGTKIHGPRGVGCLYKKRQAPIVGILQGGGQQAGVRSGTEALPQIRGMVVALEKSIALRTAESERLQGLRQKLVVGLRALRPNIVINGWSETAASSSRQGPQNELEMQSPHIINLTLPGVDTEFFVLQLDAHGIACSTKSSCLRDIDESYVLRAIGAPSPSSLRISLGRSTTAADIETLLETMARLLGVVR